MKILVLGSGGREDALVWRLAQSSHHPKIFCLPGNPGTERNAENVPIAITDTSAIREFCRIQKIDLVVIGPEAPLVTGLADVLREDRINVMGPGKKGAQLEGSKIFAKEFMERHSVPTAKFRVFDDPRAAKEYAQSMNDRIVIKADGLAAGKGVLLPRSPAESEKAIDQMMISKEFGDAGRRVVIEEKLEGEEVSLLVLMDGHVAIPLAPAQDHKRVFDNDEGPNTGGMGAYSPAPILTPVLLQKVMREVVEPVQKGLRAENIDYQGVLYVGLMITPSGPSVLEFNVRFGDPETQAILPRLKGDFAEIMMATAVGSLKDTKVAWSDAWAVCVVLASGGYPGKFDKGHVIQGIESASELNDVKVFHAGTTWQGRKLVTSGGRVLNVVGLGEDAESAITNAYKAVSRIQFTGMHYRKDIGRRALLTLDQKK